MLRQPTQEETRVLKRWQMSTFAVMLFGYVGYYLCRKNISAALPLLKEAFNYSNTELGQIGSVALIVYAIGKFINGPLGDRVGGRKVFLLGMIGAIVTNLLFAQGDNIYWFIVVWAIGHYFLSMGWGGLAKTVGAWCPPEKNGTVMGFISINFQFGGVVSTFLAGTIVALGFGWQYVFIVPAGFLFLVFIWSFFASKSHPHKVYPNVKFPPSSRQALAEVELDDDTLEETVNPLDVMRSLFSMRIFHILLVFSVLTTILRQIFFFWTTQLFTDIGLDPQDAIFKSALFPFAGCIGTIFLGWYTDKYAKNGDRARMMWIMLAGLTLSLILLALFGSGEMKSTSMVVILSGFAGFFLLGPYSMSSGALTLDIAGSRGAGTCTGLIDGFGYIGASVSVFLSGYLSDHYGWASVFYMLIVCALLSTVCAYMMSLVYRSKINS
ncbi:MAG: MFS transporter [Bdellovibrionales bacterium]